MLKTISKNRIKKMFGFVGFVKILIIFLVFLSFFPQIIQAQSAKSKCEFPDFFDEKLKMCVSDDSIPNSGKKPKGSKCVSPEVFDPILKICTIEDVIDRPRCLQSEIFDLSSLLCVDSNYFCATHPKNEFCLYIENPTDSDILSKINYKSLYVETLEATEVKENTAVLNGRGGPNLSLDPKLETTGYFRYSKKPIAPIYCNDIYGTFMTSTEDKPLGSSGDVKVFSQAVSNLTPDTMYYYCAIVSNKKNIAYGGPEIVKSFKTKPLRTSVTTVAPTQITETSANLKGTYNAVKKIKKTYFKYREVVNEDSLGTVDSEWKTLLVKDYSTSSTGSINRTYANINYALEKLKPSTTYEYSAWVDDETESVSGTIMYFKTKTAVTEENCEEKGTCPIDEDYYCVMNPLELRCLANLIVSPRSISYNKVSINKPIPTSALIKNIGGGNITTSVSNIFQISKNPYAEEIKIVTSSVVNNIKKNGGLQKTNSGITYPEEGIYFIRACADSSLAGPREDGSTGTIAEISEKDNCGGGTINPGAWTLVNVNTPICRPPKFYDQGSKSCVVPSPCDPNTEIYNYQTNSCVLKKICAENETFNRYTNTCVLIEVDCMTNPTDPVCLPGPGDIYTGNDGGGNDYGNDGGGNDYKNNTWNDYSSALGGTWEGGGWVNGFWIGGKYKTQDGRTWTGGIWKDGYWSGGGWDNTVDGKGGDTGSQGGIDGLVVGQRAVPPSDAIVRYHEGVEHVFVRQIMKNTTLQGMYGYTSDKNLSTFSWDLADLFARMLGYIGDDRKEIRVSYPDIAAYELRLVNGKLIVYEYYDNRIVSIQNISTAIKNKADYEYYFNKN